jgi:hypothetical protein
MIWIAKTFEKYAQWSGDQDFVARLQMAAAASGSDYTQVLMALAEHVDDQRETVFIGLPALEFAAPFVGYEVTAPPAKRVASLLIGDQNEFEKHFRFPTIKA